MVKAAHNAGADIEQIFLTEPGLAIAPKATPTFLVDDRTIRSLSETQTPQGVVAVVRFIERDVDELRQVLPSGGPALVLVLPNLADPGNAGTLLRSAVAFGAHAVCFGTHAVEPYNDKVVRASMGTLFQVPVIRYVVWRELAGALRDRSISIVAADASGPDVRSLTLPTRAALIVGQERHGLAGIERADINMLVGLPQRKAIESLNAGVAGSLLLYELSRANGLLAASPGTNRT